ncbi:MAG: hypothetical protein ACKVHA_02600 [Fidelibacterota bacterium]|mgnify:CR=1 FL=1|jgi:hypothetical protein|tara:strand:+ start:1532 stop:1942 length:411 start_codon:yes stop_codon:yes gene_type:complete
MKLRSDINAMTALVYGGAAFLLVVVGFRSILATLGDHIGAMTYLSILALIIEFCLLILYAKAIYGLGPESSDGPSSSSSSSGASVASMDSKEISDLTKAVVKVAEMGEGLANLSNGKVRDQIKKEVNDILSKAITK